jgi:hypothetical protein
MKLRKDAKEISYVLTNHDHRLRRSNYDRRRALVKFFTVWTGITRDLDHALAKRKANPYQGYMPMIHLSMFR